MNIVDAVMFFNEVELLQARCSEHYDHVSKIIVIEAERTHSNLPKDMVFADNRSKFVEWQDKIEHVIVPASAFIDCEPPAPQHSALVNETTQRFWPISQGLVGYDWYMCADADEIVRSEEFDGLKEALRNCRTHGMQVSFDFFYYGLNCKYDNLWPALRFRHISCSDRSWKKSHGPDVYSKSIGWHFSYMGGREAILQKLQAIQHHREARVKVLLKFPRAIDRAIYDQLDMFNSPESGGPLVELDSKSHLPQYMLDNWDTYKQFWLDLSARPDFLDGYGRPS